MLKEKRQEMKMNEMCVCKIGGDEVSPIPMMCVGCGTEWSWGRAEAEQCIPKGKEKKCMMETRERQIFDLILKSDW